MTTNGSGTSAKAPIKVRRKILRLPSPRSSTPARNVSSAAVSSTGSEWKACRS